jgi:hypothetical protein
MGRRRGVSGGVSISGSRRRRRRLLGLGGVDDGGEGVGGDETHEEEGLEDGVGELRSLVQELGRFGGVGGG